MVLELILHPFYILFWLIKINAFKAHSGDLPMAKDWEVHAFD